MSKEIPNRQKRRVMPPRPVPKRKGSAGPARRGPGPERDRRPSG